MNGQNGVAPLCARAPNGSTRHSIGVEAGYGPFCGVNINAAPIRALLGGAYVTPGTAINMGAFRSGPSTFFISGPSSISEGSGGIFTVTTTFLPNGTTLFWRINHISTSAADFQNETGIFTVNNNQGQFQINLVSDTADVLAETFRVAVRTLSSTRDEAVSPVVTVNDTSPTPPTFVTFTANTENAFWSPGMGTVPGRTVTGGPYVLGKANSITVTVNAGVYLWGRLQTGSGIGLYIQGLNRNLDTIQLNINGIIMGQGGNGANFSPGGPGLAALEISAPVYSMSGTGGIGGGGGGGGGNGDQPGGGGGGAGGGTNLSPGAGAGGNPGQSGGNGSRSGNLRGAGGGGRIAGYGPGDALGALKPGVVACGGSASGGGQGGGGGASWAFTGNGDCRVVGGNGGIGNAVGESVIVYTGFCGCSTPSLIGGSGGGGGGFGAAGGSGASQRVTGGSVRAGGAGGPAVRTNGNPFVTAGFGGAIWGAIV